MGWRPNNREANATSAADRHREFRSGPADVVEVPGRKIGLARVAITGELERRQRLPPAGQEGAPDLPLNVADPWPARRNSKAG